MSSFSLASRDAVCQACDVLFSAGESGDSAEIAISNGWPEPIEFGPHPAQSRVEAIDALANRIICGHDVRLMCWCYPKRCHAEVVTKLVKERVKCLLKPTSKRVRN